MGDMMISYKMNSRFVSWFHSSFYGVHGVDRYGDEYRD